VERTDRGIGIAAPLLAFAQRVPLPLGEQLLGHIQPAAAAHRAARQRDDAAILELDGLGSGPVFSRLS
jgi:hypothetical protein